MQGASKENVTYGYMNKLYAKAKEIQLDKRDRIVIFSDLHMGDGGNNDDFVGSAALFENIIRNYYWPKDFTLVLNGDVEELQRFSLASITQQWRHIYRMFDGFAHQDRLFKTLGNHDMGLRNESMPAAEYELLDALKIMYKGESLFVYHGHQLSRKYQKNNELIGFTLKYVANPLGIKNYSVSHSSKKQYSIEKKAYRYSRYKKVASIIGHTHRPLFESPLSKVDRLKYKVEQLCRTYVRSADKERKKLKKEIEESQKKLKKILKLRRKEIETLGNNIYNHDLIFHVPCVFNSGCVIGNRGITAIEICEGEISLIHWFDSKLDKRFIHSNGRKPEALPGTECFRMKLKNESLDYIFTRIQLLA